MKGVQAPRVRGRRGESLALRPAEPVAVALALGVLRKESGLGLCREQCFGRTNFAIVALSLRECQVLHVHQIPHERVSGGAYA